jgi:hypothetical protein
LKLFNATYTDNYCNNNSIKYVNLLKEGIFMITQALEILGQIHIYERKSYKNLSSPKRRRYLNIYLYTTALLPIIAVIIVFIGYLHKDDTLKIAALSFLIVSYLLIFFTPIFSAWVYRDAIRRFFQNTLLPQLTNSSIAIAASSHFMPQLMRCSRTELELTAIEFKAERNALEKRIGLIAGAIDKVGLGPGLIAAIAAVVKLQGDLKGFGAADWLMGAAYGVLGLYAIAAFGHMSILKIDRALNLLDLVIAKKNY